MKRVWKKMTAVALCALPMALIAQEKIRIDGTIKDITDVTYHKVYLMITETNGKRLDSSDIVDGKYHFDITVEEPVLGMLLGVQDRSKLQRPVMVTNDNRIQVYLSEGHIKINNEKTFANAKVEGSPAHHEYEKLNILASRYQQEIMSLMQASQDKSLTTEAKADLQRQIAEKQNEMQKSVYGEYVRNNPDSPIFFYAFQRYAGGMRGNPTKVLAMIADLPQELRDSQQAKALAKRIKGQMEIAIGSMAPDFVQNTPEGKPVALSSFKGQYVLLDFWASWCGPCRKENPHVVAAYEAFKDKNFTVLGVSLDRANDRDRWIKAIEDDNLGAWTNVSDLKYWNNEAALRYGVTGIPQNFLIDPSGKIIARNLRGENLHKTLKEILDAEAKSD